MGNACAGRVALVTGASRGIGRAIATRLAAEGADVAVVSRPQSGMPQFGSAPETVERIEALGRRALGIEADLADPAVDPAAIVAQTEAALGPVDILVNNVAGGGYRPFLEWTDEQIGTVLQLNFWVPWHFVRAVLPGMQARGEGWILNVSSASAIRPDGPPFPANAPSKQGTIYGGTKAFLDRWTASLASELHGRGIAVNTIAPQAAAATESLVTYSQVPDSLIEPLDTMAESALALCAGDPNELTGVIGYSLQVLVDLDRPTYDLTGRELVDGWQPRALPEKIAIMTAHRNGQISAGEVKLHSATLNRTADPSTTP
jgi:NAD(P)-dependent dehydrogenase (short-subunit alcohol dehydrogenase family)